jgi:hypothetical protein
MVVQLTERLAKFKLVLHEKKTRPIEFGNLASKLREQRGTGRCEAFNFLGFTHHNALSLDWRFVLSRRSQRSLAWTRIAQLLERFPLPRVRISHPLPALCDREWHRRHWRIGIGKHQFVAIQIDRDLAALAELAEQYLIGEHP